MTGKDPPRPHFTPVNTGSKRAASYEAEQRTLTDTDTLLNFELDQEQERAMNVAQFIALVRKYPKI